MAITIITNIESHIPAFGFNVVRASSDRFEETKTTSAITIGEDSGGKLQLTVADGTNFRAGDSITVSGATLARAAINGRHNINTVTGNNLLTTTDWGAMADGAWGTCERSNNNFSMRLDIKSGATVVQSLYRYPGKVGSVIQCVFEVEKIAFDREFVTTGTVHNLQVREYTMVLTEVYQNAAYESIDGSTSDLNSGTAVVIYKSANITDRLVLHPNTRDFLHGFETLTIRSGQKVPVSFFCHTKATAYKLVNGSQTIDISDTTGSVLYWLSPEAGNITLRNVSLTHDLAETTVALDSRCYHNAMTLYFLNRYGGFDPYDFVDVEEEQEAEKQKYQYKATQAVDYDVGAIVQHSFKRLRMTGRTGARDQLQYIRDLVSSDEVYDEDGSKVYVVSKVVRIYGDEVTPEIVVEYKNDRCISS